MELKWINTYVKLNFKGEKMSMKSQNYLQCTTVETNLITRREIAQGVIVNAKEIIREGKDGKKVKQIIALIPLSLMKVDRQSYQREEKRHIMNMVKNWDDEQCSILLVNYRSDEGYFYVIDGQHRTIAASLLGLEYLVCEIYKDLTVEEEAKRYLQYNTGTKSLSPFDTFKANICWGESTDVAIKEVCDKHDIEIIDRKSKNRSLRSVSSARDIMRNGGILALDWIFSLIEDAHWEDFKESYSSDILKGLQSIYIKYNSNLNTVRKCLIDFMKGSNPSEMIGIGNAEYPTQGRATRIRLVFEEIVNASTTNQIEKMKVIA